MEDFIIHRIRGYISRILLIEYDDRMLLIDSGSRNDVPRIRRYCEEKLKRPVSDIKLCIVTHIHPDHAGGAKLLRKKYGIKLAAHRDIDRWYGGITGSLQHILDSIMAHSMRTLQGNRIQRVWYDKKIHPDIILDEGDHIPEFPGWEILHVPGHTLHDIAVFHRERKILYAADAIIKDRGKWLPPIPVFFRGSMKQSYKKMEKLAPLQILTAHGDDIDKSEIVDVFDIMISRLESPLNTMTRTAYSISIFAPQVWKRALQKMAGKRNKNSSRKSPE